MYLLVVKYPGNDAERSDVVVIRGDIDERHVTRPVAHTDRLSALPI